MPPQDGKCSLFNRSLNDFVVLWRIDSQSIIINISIIAEDENFFHGQKLSSWILSNCELM